MAGNSLYAGAGGSFLINPSLAPSGGSGSLSLGSLSLSVPQSPDTAGRSRSPSGRVLGKLSRSGTWNPHASRADLVEEEPEHEDSASIREVPDEEVSDVVPGWMRSLLGGGATRRGTMATFD